MLQRSSGWADGSPDCVAWSSTDGRLKVSVCGPCLELMMDEQIETDCTGGYGQKPHR